MQGAFTGGGSNAGIVRDNQDRFELENYTTSAQGAHSIKFGGRLRLTRDANYSNSGFNGNYIYSSLDCARLIVESRSFVCIAEAGGVRRDRRKSRIQR